MNFREYLEESQKPKTNELLKIYLDDIEDDTNFVDKASLGFSVINAYNQKTGNDYVRNFAGGDLPKAKSSVGNTIFKALDKEGKIKQLKGSKNFKVLK